MTLRKPSILEWILMIPSCGLFFLIAIDFKETFDSLPCHVATNSSCYPWGAEGPVAGIWAYQSKAFYLLDLSIKAIALLIAIILPFLIHRRRLNIVTLTAIPLVVIGITCLEFIMSYYN